MEKEILIAITLIAIVIIAVVALPLYFNSTRNSSNQRAAAPPTTIASTHIFNQTPNNPNVSTTSLSTTTILATTSYTTITSSNSNFEIQTGFYNSSIMGDASTVVIPITIFDAKTDEPLTTPIQVQTQTSIGSVSSKCPAPSVCNITFTSPQTAELESAQISIDAGGTIKTLNINITPDETASIALGFIMNETSLHNLLYSYQNTYNITLYLSQNQLYSVSGKNITLIGDNIAVAAYAKDKNGVAVPDGIPINFSSNAGTLSNSSCITGMGMASKGVCGVSYTLVPKIGKFEITAYSYNVSSSVYLNITKPTVSNVTYSIHNNTLSCNYYSGTAICDTISGSALFTIGLKNQLNGPVNNSSITLTDAPVGGTFNQSCNTNTGSSCSISYAVNYNTSNLNVSYLMVHIYANGQTEGYIMLTCSNGGLTCK